MPDPHLPLRPRLLGDEVTRAATRRSTRTTSSRPCRARPPLVRAPDLARERARGGAATRGCARRGAGFGTWAQGLPAAAELAAVRSYDWTFHIANVETAHEDAVTDAALDELVSLRLPNGLAVIFTEGAWGRDRERSQRWRKRGFAAIPEAIVSENPQATIGAMLELSAALGWPGSGRRRASTSRAASRPRATAARSRSRPDAGTSSATATSTAPTGRRCAAGRGGAAGAGDAAGRGRPSRRSRSREQPAKPAKPAAARALSRCGPRSSRRSSAGTRRRPPPRGARWSGGSRTPTTRHGRSWRHRSWPRSTPRACQEETRPPRLLRPLRASAAPARRPPGRSRPSGRSSSAAAGPA